MTDSNIKYLDTASTTKVDDRVLAEMLPYFNKIFGNASSNHSYGEKAKKAIEKARVQVSNIINSDANEIIFTSGATESINLAIKGYSEANLEKGNHIITVQTEHKAVLETCKYLEDKGYEITYLGVDKNGLICLDELKKSILEKTILICVMYVNNEIGVIQPVKEIGLIAQENNIAFLCDATQAVGKINVDVVAENIDMLCFSSHKLNGPKGVGVLYKKSEINLTPLFHGGGQEKGFRGGTYNTPLIVGLGKACELAKNELDINYKQASEKKAEFAAYYEDNNIGVLNFKDVKTSPYILSISLKNNEAEKYLIQNSDKFVASTGSACNAEVIEISHVLKAIGVADRQIIRISL